jgi:flagellar motility protein MotE (MotC chaperone)
MLFIIVGLGVFLFYTQQMAKNLLNDMARENEEEFARHTASLEEMRTSFEAERQEQEQINVRYTEEIERLRADYNERLADLEARITTRRQRFIRETSGRPDEMANRLRERLGWSEP